MDRLYSLRSNQQRMLSINTSKRIGLKCKLKTLITPIYKNNFKTSITITHDISDEHIRMIGHIYISQVLNFVKKISLDCFGFPQSDFAKK